MGAAVAFDHASRFPATRSLVLIDLARGSEKGSGRRARLALALRRTYASRGEAIERFRFLPESSYAREPLRLAIARRSIREEPDASDTNSTRPGSVSPRARDRILRTWPARRCSSAEATAGCSPRPQPRSSSRRSRKAPSPSSPTRATTSPSTSPNGSSEPSPPSSDARVCNSGLSPGPLPFRRGRPWMIDPGSAQKAQARCGSRRCHAGRPARTRAGGGKMALSGVERLVQHASEPAFEPERALRSSRPRTQSSKGSRSATA